MSVKRRSKDSYHQRLEEEIEMSESDPEHNRLLESSLDEIQIVRTDESPEQELVDGRRMPKKKTERVSDSSSEKSKEKLEDLGTVMYGAIVSFFTIFFMLFSAFFIVYIADKILRPKKGAQ